MTAWFRKERTRLPPPEKKSRMPEGLWMKCNNCSETLYKKEIVRNLRVCPRCNYHFGVSARERTADLLDGAFQEIARGLRSNDPLEFKDTKPYRQRLDAGAKSTGLDDAVLAGKGTIEGMPVVLVVMEYGFIGGSMGVIVGEKITRAIECALEDRSPLIVISRSGGARMQEGALSLMQMAKISAALARLDAARVPYFSILTDPTTGGVTASFAMLGDLNIAEPRALIGFAGPRVIEQTIRQPLPPGFQRSEHLMEHGMLDLILERRQMKDVLARLLRFFTWDASTAAAAEPAAERELAGEAEPEERSPVEQPLEEPAALEPAVETAEEQAVEEEGAERPAEEERAAEEEDREPEEEAPSPRPAAFRKRRASR